MDDASLGLLCIVTFLGGCGWLAFGLLLIGQRAVEEENNRLALRAEALGEELAKERKELAELREIADYRTRLIARYQATPPKAGEAPGPAARPHGARIESASYLARPEEGKGQPS